MVDAINHEFVDLKLNSKIYDLAHLRPFVLSVSHPKLPKHGIRLRISFQSHVFSKSIDKSAPTKFDFYDENERKRLFCEERYERSLGLPDLSRAWILNNANTWISKDRNKSSNLALLNSHDRKDGDYYAGFFYLFPSRHDEIEVELVFKSAYVRYIKFQKETRYFNVQQKIKECHFKQKTVPS